MEKKFLYFFKQHITNVFIRTCSWINVWWKSTDLLITAFMCLGILSTGLSHCCCMISCNSWDKNSGFSDSWWLVTVHLPLDHVPEFFKGGSSLDIGLAVTRSWSGGPSSTPWFPLAAGYACSIVPLKKIQFFSLSTQKTASVLDRFFEHLINLNTSNVLFKDSFLYVCFYS